MNNVSLWYNSCHSSIRLTTAIQVLLTAKITIIRTCKQSSCSFIDVVFIPMFLPFLCHMPVPKKIPTSESFVDVVFITVFLPSFCHMPVSKKIPTSESLTQVPKSLTFQASLAYSWCWFNSFSVLSLILYPHCHPNPSLAEILDTTNTCFHAGMCFLLSGLFLKVPYSGDYSVLFWNAVCSFCNAVFHIKNHINHNFSQSSTMGHQWPGFSTKLLSSPLSTRG